MRLGISRLGVGDLLQANLHDCEFRLQIARDRRVPLPHGLDTELDLAFRAVMLGLFDQAVDFFQTFDVLVGVLTNLRVPLLRVFKLLKPLARLNDDVSGKFELLILRFLGR